MIQSFRDEFARYRTIGERALAQIADSKTNDIPYPDGNSAAMLVRHIAGNLVSRFTDFLTTDGEKPWRNRDVEFEERHYTPDEMDDWWRRGWTTLEAAVGELDGKDLDRTVTIRKETFTVHEALARASAHVAYHIGQLVLLARLHAAGDWAWISVPKGGSEAYNANPTLEHGFRSRDEDE